MPSVTHVPMVRVVSSGREFPQVMTPNMGRDDVVWSTSVAALVNLGSASLAGSGTMTG